jgi:hypothetical protein
VPQSGPIWKLPNSAGPTVVVKDRFGSIADLEVGAFTSAHHAAPDAGDECTRQSYQNPAHPARSGRRAP